MKRMRVAAQLRFAILVAAFVIVPVVPALAASGTTFVAGWEGDGVRQGYGFASASARWPAAAPAALVARLQASQLYYHFAEAGGVTRVLSPGVTLAVGPSLVGSGGSTALLVGLDVRRERRDGVAGETLENQHALELQWEAAPGLGPRMRAFTLAQYSFANDYTYGRVSLGRQIDNVRWTGPVTTVLGLEAAGQGNEDSEAWQAGGYAEWAFVRAHASVSVHGGYKQAGSPGRSLTGTSFVGVGAYLAR
jgi:Cellulose biosynthesis protein BcsS